MKLSQPQTKVESVCLNINRSQPQAHHTQAPTSSLAYAKARRVCAFKYLRDEGIADVCVEDTVGILLSYDTFSHRKNSYAVKARTVAICVASTAS